MKRTFIGTPAPKAKEKCEKRIVFMAHNVMWPLMVGKPFYELCRQLKTLERPNIVTGCNAVIKLLQNGQAAAFFVQDQLLPKSFVKVLIQRARKRNPSVLPVVVPSLPLQLETTAQSVIMMAIVDRKTENQSSATEDVLHGIKNWLLQRGFISKNELHPKPAPRKTIRKVKKNPQKPMTKEEIAKLYILEPAGAQTNAKRNRVDHFKSADFISFSDKNKLITIKSKNTGPPSSQQLFDRKKVKKATNVSKADSKVRENPSQVQPKKKKKKQADAAPEKQSIDQKTSKKPSSVALKADAVLKNSNKLQKKKKKKQTDAPSENHFIDQKASKKSTNVTLKATIEENFNQVQPKKKKITGAEPDQQSVDPNASKKSTNVTVKTNTVQETPHQGQPKKKKKQDGAPSANHLSDQEANKKSTNVELKPNKAQGNSNQLQDKKKKLKKSLTAK